MHDLDNSGAKYPGQAFGNTPGFVEQNGGLTGFARMIAQTALGAAGASPERRGRSGSDDQYQRNSITKLEMRGGPS